MRKMLASAVLVLGLATSTVSAQDIFVPQVMTADPGMLFPNAPRAVAQADAQEITLDAEAEARIRQAVEALVPEYNRRLARDGETSANDWIRQKAFELGQREADLMKQRLGME